jgi:hypothetical protein
VHNPLLLQPLGHWFTFISRKHEHLAVGSSGRGLTDSRGSAVLSVASPSPFVSLLYHTLRDLSRGIFAFAGLFLLGVPYHPSWCPLRGLPLDCSYIVSHLFPNCNRQNAQIREKYFLDICATFLLTNCWRCIIMEIRGPDIRGRAAENQLEKDDRISSRP